METQAPPGEAPWLERQGLTASGQDRFRSLIEELIGVPYQYSPEATSAALLKSLHNRPGGKRLEVAEMPPPALIPNLETDLHWIRSLSREEVEAPFIVAYDVNAAYLAACSSLTLGVGVPKHVGPGDLPSVIELECGYFRPLEREWISSPTAIWYLHNARGHRGEIAEAWIWPETSRPLEPWYKVLRDAREKLMIEMTMPRSSSMFFTTRPEPVILASLAAVKKMYTGFIGRLASTGWDRTGDVLYRPDWRHMIIATRRTRLQRIMAQCDPAPFAAYSDCLYFALSEHQHVTGLKIGTNPGAFKIHGTERNEGDVRAAVDAGDLNQLVRLVR